MHIKQYLSLFVTRQYFHLKSIRLLAWVPVALLNAILPAFIFLNYNQFGATAETLRNLLQIAMLLLPPFSVWWNIFVLREYLEADGNDVLFVCSHPCKVWDAGCLFLLYVLNMGLWFGVLAGMLPEMRVGLELLRLLCACVFYFGLVYFLLFFTHSVTITLMAALIYTLANFISNVSNVFFPFYYSPQPVETEQWFTVYLPLALCGLVLTCAGIMLNQYHLKFN